MTPKTAVLAGDHVQYKQWLLENDRDPHECIYVSDPLVVKGRPIDEVVEVGTFWERRDANEIHEAVRRRYMFNEER